LLRRGEQPELLAAKLGISPWEIRFRNAIEPGGVLSNGQIADARNGIEETLLAVKDVIEAHPDAGIACSFKNAGKGVGVPDVGRAKLKVQNGAFSSAPARPAWGRDWPPFCCRLWLKPQDSRARQSACMSRTRW